MKRWQKITLATAVAGSLLISTNYRKAIHNILSHHPGNITSGDSQQDFVEFCSELPRMLMTRGDYDGVPKDATCTDNMDLNAIYLGEQDNPLPYARHRPLSASIPSDIRLYNPSCLIDGELLPHLGPQSLERVTAGLLERIRDIRPGEIIPLHEEGSQNDRYYWHYGEGFLDMQKAGPLEGFGNFTLSIGHDEAGRYVSFYDIFDFEHGKGGFSDSNSAWVVKIGTRVLPKIGTPIYFYRRWYFNELGITDEAIEHILQKKDVQ